MSGNEIVVAPEKHLQRCAMTGSDFIELIRVPQLTDRAPYAYAAVASDVRRLVFTAGACPLDEQGETVAVGDVAGAYSVASASSKA
jgi:enamine deaminase RidA (YjgF/YER057c/UK114 family)